MDPKVFGIGQLAAFGAASVIIILIPGPSVMFVVGRALAHGRRTAVLSAIGNAVGGFSASALVAFGLGAIIQQSALAFGIVKYAGAAYLVYLGVKAFRGAKDLVELPVADETGTSRTAVAMFEGFLVGFLNPKSILFFLAILPQFVNAAAGFVVLQMLVLGALFAAIAAACDTGWSFAAASAREVLGSPRVRRGLGRAGGTSMIGLGIAAAAGERA